MFGLLPSSINAKAELLLFTVKNYLAAKSITGFYPNSSYQIIYSQLTGCLCGQLSCCLEMLITILFQKLPDYHPNNNQIN
jgi:hypothetical protein